MDLDLVECGHGIRDCQQRRCAHSLTRVIPCLVPIPCERMASLGDWSGRGLTPIAVEFGRQGLRSRMGAGDRIMGEITDILKNIGEADSKVVDQLMPLVYDELRRIAIRRMASQDPAQTLQPTALVNEAWLKLMGAQKYSWENRRHFLNAAGEAMRQILVDSARRKKAVRNGGKLQRVDIEGLDIPLPTSHEQLLLLDEALTKLSKVHPSKAELVRLKFFVGLDNTEAASTLGIPLRSVERQWAFARAWLRVEMKGEPPMFS